MTYLRTLLAFALCASSVCAAQTPGRWSAYGTLAATDYGYTLNSSYSSGDIGFKGLAAGVLAGGFYNFPIQSRVTVGIDVRGEYSPGSKGGEFVSADLRVGFVPTRNRLRPFFGLGGGVITTSHPTNLFNASTRNTGGGLQLDFGLDVRLNEHFDYRALDYGAIAGGSTGTAFLATGVVYHF